MGYKFNYIMNDPIKIIHKYKNNNIKKMLLKIEKLQFNESLDLLTNSEIKEFENFYGDYWYEKLFVSYHILRQKEILSNNSTKKKSLEKKFGKEWIDKHLNDYKINRTKVLYNYSTNVERYKLIRKRKKPTKKTDTMDFTTNKKTFQLGGNEYEEFDSDEELEMEELGDLPNIMEQTVDDEEEDENNNENQEETEEINNLNIEVETNKNIENTSKLITKALEDKKWEKNIEKNIADFDESKDNDVYDASLNSKYTKKYIFNFYIYKDDTIKTLKNKISC